MLIFIKILVVRKQQKQLRTRLSYFSYRQKFFGVLLCILDPTSPVPWRLKGGEAAFKSDLKERVKLEQEDSMWVEMVMVQVEAQPKHRYRVGVGETLCWVVHISQDEAGSYSHGELSLEGSREPKEVSAQI